MEDFLANPSIIEKISGHTKKREEAVFFYENLIEHTTKKSNNKNCKWLSLRELKLIEEGSVEPCKGSTENA